MSETNCSCYLFAGPSFGGCEQLVSEARQSAEVLSPVQRHDVEKLVASERPGVMVLVDGYFQQCLSVGHAEIREAVAAGWSVWGLSSLGAIRAYEMRDFGVQGYGRVYKSFFEYEDFRDDEVALLHEPDPPYRFFSEPLIHIRVFLRHLVSVELLTAAQEERILAGLMSTWFGNRTLSLLRSSLLELAPQNAAVIDKLLNNFRPFRIKQLDLSDFLREQPWKRKGKGGTG
ncbi:MAG TPA: TfuA-like protein [Pyrinomonadaceae bacterium]|jgi:hypothetical protein|nr:TfuA-like protein [Pyrinomonadaceae bacterium]